MNLKLLLTGIFYMFFASFYFGQKINVVDSIPVKNDFYSNDFHLLTKKSIGKFNSKEKLDTLKLYKITNADTTKLTNEFIKNHKDIYDGKCFYLKEDGGKNCNTYFNGEKKKFFKFIVVNKIKNNYLVIHQDFEIEVIFLYNMKNHKKYFLNSRPYIFNNRFLIGIGSNSRTNLSLDIFDLKTNNKITYSPNLWYTNEFIFYKNKQEKNNLGILFPKIKEYLLDENNNIVERNNYLQVQIDHP